MAAAACTSRTEIAGAGDQPAAALGVGVDRARAALGRARHVGRRLRRAAGLRAPNRRRACTSSATPYRDVGGDGSDALGAPARSLVPRPSLGAALRRAGRRGRALAAGRGGPLFLPYLAGERTPTRTRTPRAFVGCRSATTAAPRPGRARGRRLRAPRLARAAPRLGVDADVGRVSGGGARSRLWLEIVASVLGIPLERTAVEEGSAYGAALLAGVRAGSSRTCTRRSRAASASASGSSRRGLAVATTTATRATAPLYPAVKTVEGR